MRKWTYPYLEVLVEQVRKKNEIFRSPGRAEVRKAELLIFGMLRAGTGVTRKELGNQNLVFDKSAKSTFKI